MSKKQLNVLIPEELKASFDKAVHDNIGDMNGAKSFAATQAIKDWIEKQQTA